jgi:branched-subunit amino acid aminotransferase/4-amino-4-deoxychorismate lyase
MLAYYVERDLLLPRENLDRYTASADRYMASADLSADRSTGAAAGLVDRLRAKFAFRRAVDGTDANRCLRAWGPLG